MSNILISKTFELSLCTRDMPLKNKYPDIILKNSIYAYCAMLQQTFNTIELSNNLYTIMRVYLKWSWVEQFFIRIGHILNGYDKVYSICVLALWVLLINVLLLVPRL